MSVNMILEINAKPESVDDLISWIRENLADTRASKGCQEVNAYTDGADHGSGSVAFVIGDSVKGGLYGEYPSLEPSQLDEGDLQWNNDFRGTYATLLEKWMGLDSKPILEGTFEQFDFIK